MCQMSMAISQSTQILLCLEDLHDHAVGVITCCLLPWLGSHFFLHMALQSRFKDESWKGTFESAIPGICIIHFHIIVTIINPKNL